MKIALIGCGWLGKQLFDNLILEHQIVGTYNHTEFICNNNAGKTIYYRLGDTVPDEIKECTKVVLMVPPRIRRASEDEIKQALLNHLNFIKQLNPNVHFVYTSSTSVYSEYGSVNEETPTSGNIAEIEGMITNRFSQSTIFRLAGLAGPNRTIVKHFIKKGSITNSENNCNLVHSYDVVQAIKHTLENNTHGIYNICSAHHPTKGEVYNHWAQNIYGQTLELDNQQSLNKIVDSSKWRKTTDYTIVHDDPMNFF